MIYMVVKKNLKKTTNKSLIVYMKLHNTKSTATKRPQYIFKDAFIRK